MLVSRSVGVSLRSLSLRLARVRGAAAFPRAVLQHSSVGPFRLYSKQSRLDTLISQYDHELRKKERSVGGPKQVAAESVVDVVEDVEDVRNVEDEGDERDKVFYSAQITDIQDLRNFDGVRLFTMKVLPPADPDTPPLTFYPGQYVEMHVPSDDTPDPVGFTILSTPSQLPEMNFTITLEDPDPAAECLQDIRIECPEDVEEAEVAISVCGDFRWPPPPANTSPRPSGLLGSYEQDPLAHIRHVVFIGEWSGMSPLVSILQHLHETNQLGPYDGKKRYKATLFYAYRPTQEEYDQNGLTLPFLDRIYHILTDDRKKAMAQNVKDKYLDVQLHMKRQPGEVRNKYIATPKVPGKGRKPKVQLEEFLCRSTMEEDILEAMAGEKDEEVLVYICGAYLFTEDLADALRGRRPGMRVLAQPVLSQGRILLPGVLRSHDDGDDE